MVHGSCYVIELLDVFLVRCQYYVFGLPKRIQFNVLPETWIEIRKGNILYVLVDEPSIKTVFVVVLVGIIEIKNCFSNRVLIQCGEE